MINYNIIGDSITFYESKGFQRIESPWTVTSAISNITKPSGATDFSIREKNKVLVASGEQSFLALYNKGFLPNGKFQTVTPCFRDEQFDLLHTKYFIKNELIITENVCLKQLQSIVNDARNFFRKYCLLPKKNDSYLYRIEEIDDVYIIKNNDIFVKEVDIEDSYRYPSYDLSYRGIELGSYGIRQCEFLTWIYGTGVAEPRLSRTMEIYGISH